MAYMDGALSKPALCLAAQNGHISVLEWLKWNNLERSFSANDASLIAHHAAKGGQVAVLDFVKDHSMLLTTSNSIARDCLCGEAANNGNLHVLDWL
jgi:hypothetical protein